MRIMASNNYCYFFLTVPRRALLQFDLNGELLAVDFSAMIAVEIPENARLCATKLVSREFVYGTCN